MGRGSRLTVTELSKGTLNQLVSSFFGLALADQPPRVPFCGDRPELALQAERFCACAGLGAGSEHSGPLLASGGCGRVLKVRAFEGWGWGWGWGWAGGVIVGSESADEMGDKDSK